LKDRIEAPAEAGEVLLMEDQEVTQACSPHAYRERAHRQHGLVAYGRRSKHLDAARCCYARNIRAEFAIINLQLEQLTPHALRSQDTGCLLPSS